MVTAKQQVDYRRFLRQLDEADVEITDFEADFLESFLKNPTRPFTDKQAVVIEKMIGRYGSQLERD